MSVFVSEFVVFVVFFFGMVPVQCTLTVVACAGVLSVSRSFGVPACCARISPATVLAPQKSTALPEHHHPELLVR